MPLNKYISFYTVTTLILITNISTYGIGDLTTNSTTVVANIPFIINRF